MFSNIKRRIHFKTLLPKSLYGRFFLIILLPLALVQAVSAYVFLKRNFDSVTRVIASNISENIEVLSNIYADKDLRGTKTDQIVYKTKSMRIMLGPPAPLQVLKKPRVWGGSILLKELEEIMTYPFSFSEQLSNFSIKVNLPKSTLIARIPKKRLVPRSTLQVMIWQSIAALIFLIVALIFMRNQVKPIERLSRNAERFGKGLPLRSYPLEGAREIRQASQTFNTMYQRLTRQMEQRTLLLTSISHDLRTPLTRLKLSLEMLQSCKNTEEMKTDILEMEAMLQEYLDFIRGDKVEPPQETDIFSILKDLARSFKKLELRPPLDAIPPLPLRPLAMKRCFGNIINNALQYGQKVEILIDQTQNHLRIHIDDNGPGIPPEKYEEALKPFVKLEKSRPIQKGSVGLGLSIAQDIAHNHGGKITLAPSPLGGLRVTVSLPK